jgi:peptide/nickel transport system permease protein
VSAVGRTPDTPAPAGGSLLAGRRYLLALLPAVVIALGIAFGPFAWHADPTAQALADRLQPPSVEHPLGTDNLGRDLLARVLAGGRLSLGLSLLITLGTCAIGAALGMLAAASGWLADTLFLRITDVLVGLPFLLLALAIAGLSGGGIRGIAIAICALAWVSFARVARDESRRLRGLPMIAAAVASGATPVRVYLRHILPNIWPPLGVLLVVRFSHTILTLAGLSFLGVGVQPPTAEWGAMLDQGVPYIERAPQMMLAPGLAVTISCLCVTLSAMAFERLMDPRR